MTLPKDLGKLFPSVLDRAYKQYKKFRKVRDIMNKDVVTITPEAMMDQAAKVMGEKHIGSLIVVEHGKPIGIVTERDLLSNILAHGISPEKVKVRDVMSSPLIKINSDAQIKDAAQTMIKKKGRLAVFEDDNLVGIVTASDLIRSLPEVPETQLNVDDFMTKKVLTADEKTPVAEIVKTMGEKRVGSVIITREGEPVGIFTERDLLSKLLATGKPLTMTSGEVSSSPLITAPSGISVHEAARMMAGKHIRRLPLTKNGQLVGIITARDLVEAYAQ